MQQVSKPLSLLPLILSHTGGDDYVSGPFNFTIPAENTRALLDVQIINDNLLEAPESFTLTINPSSLPSNVDIGDHNQVTVTIVDDSGKLIILKN